MAKSKAKTTIIQLASTAKTGYMRSLVIQRTANERKHIHYDPIVKRHVLFTENRKRKMPQKKPLDFSRGAFDWQKKR
ncbi:hypothetical protein HPODL_05376 [Ogataea parapolymorpha DL-1]|uniref:Large ribosomal subunit protein bL33m n=1 Tax=Ogataea parapolymorpha (strain ATCC 26012 / BCRC 20466 / JCM 22074 / NRRL Y-7560 / DL-1) TaxID=871575 RepID=W1Q862_OGAPD|nr:hypothetical protein HPODL_05376 [Ogataea parapolymorpha DL-1]ESW96623.1 hypothetical protein HPODL_05376 [Ogataea parapolymorpha DL-1]